MEHNARYMQNITARLWSIRNDTFVTHGQLMNIEGFLSAGISLGALKYTEYLALYTLAKNAYENNPDKL